MHAGVGTKEFRNSYRYLYAVFTKYPYCVLHCLLLSLSIPCRLDDVEEIYYNVGTVYTEKADRHCLLISLVSLEKVVPELTKYFTNNQNQQSNNQQSTMLTHYQGKQTPQLFFYR